MSFSTIPFLFFFLPVSLVLYRICPRGVRTALLVILSLVFYAWGDIRSLPLLLFSIAFNYFSGLELSEWRKRDNPGVTRAALWISVLLNVGILCYCKYSSSVFPIGVSFYTFSAISYIADIYRGRAPAERDPLKAALYITFFPKLISGPIARYEEFYPQIETPAPGREAFFVGGERFLIGLFKKVLLADRLGAAFAAVRAAGALSAGSAWLGMIFYSLELYFDFSGYSDMAIGLAGMFGFRIGRNFDHPYLSASISEFWRRWHISLGRWFREYVYIPLGGNRCGMARQLLNLAVVWILTGIWHGSTLNFVVWGLYHGLFVILERIFLRGRSWSGVARVFRVLLTDLVVFFGWVLFFSPSLGGALSWFGSMFGADGLGFWDDAASYFLLDNLALLAASVLFAGPFIGSLRENLVSRYPGSAVLDALLFAALLLFSAAGIVNATYSTFLYFQF